MMEGIIEYFKDTETTVNKDYMYTITKRGQKKIQKTKLGWQILIQWRDQSESWIHFKDLKESHSIEVAEFTKAWGITDEPAFDLWEP